MPRLDEEQIAARLGSGPWRREGDELVRDVELADFSAAIALVNRVAAAAEAADHHPDILVHGYRHVRLRLTDHAAGGLSAKDFALAAEIERLLER